MTSAPGAGRGMEARPRAWQTLKGQTWAEEALGETQSQVTWAGGSGTAALGRVLVPENLRSRLSPSSVFVTPVFRGQRNLAQDGFCAPGVLWLLMAASGGRPQGGESTVWSGRAQQRP